VASQPFEELGNPWICGFRGGRWRHGHNPSLCQEANETTHAVHILRRYKLPPPSTGTLTSVVSELLDDGVINITGSDSDSAKPIGKMTSRARKDRYRQSRMAQCGEVFAKPLDVWSQRAWVHARPS
jgi:hypothetical protein